MLELVVVQIALPLPELLQVLLFPDLLQVTVAESILATAIDLPSARRPSLPPSAMPARHTPPLVEQDRDVCKSICSNLFRTPNISKRRNTESCICVARNNIVGRMHKSNVRAPYRGRLRIRFSLSAEVLRGPGPHGLPDSVRQSRPVPPEKHLGDLQKN